MSGGGDDGCGRYHWILANSLGPDRRQSLWHIAAHERSPTRCSAPRTSRFSRPGRTGSSNCGHRRPRPIGEAIAKVAIPATRAAWRRRRSARRRCKRSPPGPTGAVKLWDIGSKKDVADIQRSRPRRRRGRARSAAQIAARVPAEVRVWRGSDGKPSTHLLGHQLAFDAAGTTCSPGSSAARRTCGTRSPGLDLQAFVGQGAVRAVIPMPTSALISAHRCDMWGGPALPPPL